MRRMILVLVLVLGGCGGADGGGGSPAVESTKARIEAMTDCAELQREFDTAADNFDRVEPGTEQADASLAYMQTADDRMREVGCF